MYKTLEFFEKTLMIPAMIESKQNEIRRLKDLARSLSAVDSSSERVSQSRNVQCKYAELINKAADLEAEILDDVQKLIDYQIEVGKVIDRLPKPICRVVMRELYINGLSVKEVAYKLGYTTRSIYGFRKNAVKDCTKFRLLSPENAL